MDERIIDVDGNEIIISVDGIDDFEIADISFEDAEELEGDLIITAKYLNVEFGEVYPAEIVIEDGLFKEVIPIITDDVTLKVQNYPLPILLKRYCLMGPLL